jgi:hypothetical protein
MAQQWATASPRQMEFIIQCLTQILSLLIDSPGNRNGNSLVSTIKLIIK